MRDVKYMVYIYLRTAAYTIGMFTLMIVGFAVMLGTTSPGLISSSALIYSLMAGVMSTYTIYTSYMNFALSFGSTRRGAAIGVQIGKLVTTLATLGIFALLQTLLNNVVYKGGNLVLVSAQTILPTLATLLVLNSFAEFGGALTLKYGRKGMVIMTITMVVFFGAGCGALTMRITKYGLEAASFISAILSGGGIYCICAILFAAAFSALSVSILKKYAVKG